VLAYVPYNKNHRGQYVLTAYIDSYTIDKKTRIYTSKPPFRVTAILPG